MSGKIFINYRKSLGVTAARALRDGLVERFGEEHVCFDDPSANQNSAWLDDLNEARHGLSIMLVLIPKGWESVAQDGQRSRKLINTPGDRVRTEIEKALARQIAVLPILVNREDLPSDKAAPPKLRHMMDMPFEHFRTEDSEHHVAKIAETIQVLLGPPIGRPIGPQLDAPLPIETGGKGGGRYAIAPMAAALAVGVLGGAALYNTLFDDAAAPQAYAAKQAFVAADVGETSDGAAPSELAAAQEKLAGVEAQVERLKLVAPPSVFTPIETISRAEIRRAQDALIALGYEVGAASGEIGAKTTAALASFQTQIGAAKSGQLDIATLDALTLAERYAAAAKNGGAQRPQTTFLEQLRALEPGRTLKECGSCPELAVAPSGSFAMGSTGAELANDPSEGPQHQVSIESFAVGVFETTFAEWDACVADGYCRDVAAGSEGENNTDRGWGRGRRPVMEVSRQDITGEGVEERGFLAWLNMKAVGSDEGPYRLLSEAEWEYAARAGSVEAFSWGASADEVCRYANSADLSARDVYPNLSSSPCVDRYASTAPVGSFEPNAWGLYDMHGNVAEWVSDCWGDNYDGAPTDGSARSDAACSTGVARGGAWNYGPERLRSAARIKDGPDATYFNLGFRIARSLR